MRQNLAELYRTDPVKACRLALRRTLHVNEHERLDRINEFLEGYGTEAIRGEWQNGYWCDIAAVYCNMGDTYQTTVLQERTDFGPSRFLVCSWGDWFEAAERRRGADYFNP